MSEGYEAKEKEFMIMIDNLIGAFEKGRSIFIIEMKNFIPEEERDEDYVKYLELKKEADEIMFKEFAENLKLIRKYIPNTLQDLNTCVFPK